jgi:hypothetical protein
MPVRRNIILDGREWVYATYGDEPLTAMPPLTFVNSVCTFEVLPQLKVALSYFRYTALALAVPVGLS